MGAKIREKHRQKCEELSGTATCLPRPVFQTPVVPVVTGSSLPLTAFIENQVLR